MTVIKILYKNFQEKFYIETLSVNFISAFIFVFETWCLDQFKYAQFDGDVYSSCFEQEIPNLVQTA